MRAKKSEKHLEKECVQYAERRGILSLKADKLCAGWPDRIFLLRPLAIEFKHPDKSARATQRQQATHENLPFPVHVVNRHDAFVALFEQWVGNSNAQ